MGVALLLPQQARNVLVVAASIDPGTPRTESQARTNALDHAIRSIKQRYPTYFK